MPKFLLARKKAIFALLGLLATWLPIALAAPHVTYLMWASLGLGVLGVLGVHEATNLLTPVAAAADAKRLTRADLEQLIAGVVRSIAVQTGGLPGPDVGGTSVAVPTPLPPWGSGPGNTVEAPERGTVTYVPQRCGLLSRSKVTPGSKGLFSTESSPFVISSDLVAIVCGAIGCYAYCAGHKGAALGIETRRHMDSTITIVGNLARDPELRFTPSGQAVASFGVAVNRRWQNKQTQEWEEQVSFIDVTAWGSLAENVSESLEKGARVLVTGRIEQQSWDDKDTGAKRSKLQLVADSVGPDLRWATCQVTKTERTGEPQKQASSSSRSATKKPATPFDDNPFD